MTDSFSFDTEVTATNADPIAGGAVPIELPDSLQRYGTLWPTPAEQVSDHSAEGAPWQPTARAVPQDPPQGPLWSANHDALAVQYDASQRVDPVSGQGISAGATPNHQGDDGLPWDASDWGDYNAQPNAWPTVNIGQPFTVNQGSSETRTLATDQWDATGKRVNPPDAPSAPHEVYGSQHNTTPRMIPYEVGALFDNVADSNQFTRNPGYWGVQGGMPDTSLRPQGAVAAQPPDDPYVAQSVAAAGPGGIPIPINYDLGV